MCNAYVRFTNIILFYLHNNSSGRWYYPQFTYNASSSWDDPSFWDIYISLVWTSISWKTNASSPLISKTSLGAYFLIVTPASELLLLLDEFSLVTVWSFHFFPFSVQFYSKHWAHSLYLIHRRTQTHTQMQSSHLCLQQISPKIQKDEVFNMVTAVKELLLPLRVPRILLATLRVAPTFLTGCSSPLFLTPSPQGQK